MLLNADVKLCHLKGNDAGSGAPRNRVGQISHSVVLGTFNVGEQVEGTAQDLTRVCLCILCIYLQYLILMLSIKFFFCFFI